MRPIDPADLDGPAVCWAEQQSGHGWDILYKCYKVLDPHCHCLEERGSWGRHTYYCPLRIKPSKECIHGALAQEGVPVGQIRCVDCGRVWDTTRRIEVFPDGTNEITRLEARIRDLEGRNAMLEEENAAAKKRLAMVEAGEVEEAGRTEDARRGPAPMTYKLRAPR